jgi:hypothetical protein
MAEFLFQVNHRVKERDTGRLGRITYCGTTVDPSGRFYTVLFDDGETKRTAESELLPAGPKPPGPK